MAGKKYSDIIATSNTSTVANTDIFILQRADGITYGLYGNNLSKSLGVGLSGPFSNDSVAALNNVGLRQFYYDTTGTVKIRLI